MGTVLMVMARRQGRIFALPGRGPLKNPEALPKAADYLAAEGHAVIRAHSKAEISAALTAAAPDVLVVDCQALDDCIALDVFDLLAELQPGNVTRVIQMWLRDPFDKPSIVREEFVDAYVDATCDFWQTVLSVHLCLRRPRFCRCHGGAGPSQGNGLDA